LIKRVEGLPGEEIAVHDGVFYVNGVPLAEPYVKFPDLRKEVAPGRIDPGCFLVAGDNRSHTLFAVVNRARVVGRVVVLPGF
jgi:signal peptidase I